MIATLQGSSDSNITGKHCRGEKQAKALNIIWSFSEIRMVQPVGKKIHSS